MRIKELFSNNEILNINTYLEKFGIQDYEEYISPKGIYLQKPNVYNNIEQTPLIFNNWKNTNGIIYILQDCDADGLFSASLAYMYLVHIGIDKNRLKVLFHSDKTHGLTEEIIDIIGVDIDIKTPQSGIWIPDAGTNDIEQCAFLRQYMDVLITDHHQIEVDNNIAYIDEYPYSNYHTIINNQYTDEFKVNKSLCGTGVTFKVIQYNCLLNKDYWYKDLLDMVSFANVADVMNMADYENRCFNYFGFKYIENPLLKALCSEFISKEITPTSIAWNVIPKINAVMRSNNQDLKRDLFNCMVGNINDYDKIVKNIKKQHEEQRNMTSKITDEVLETINLDSKVLIGFVSKTPYTGLVANKISSMFNKPTLIVHKTKDEYIGSVRSPIPFKKLSQKSELLTLCAGHENSYGIGFKASNLNNLINYFESLELNIEPTYTVTKKLSLKENVNKIIDKFIDYDELWGHGIPQPQFYIKINVNGEDIKELGNGSTIKITKNNLEFIKFFVSKDQRKKWFVGENKNLTLDIIGTLGYNVFRGKKTAQLQIETMEVTERENKNINDVF